MPPMKDAVSDQENERSEPTMAELILLAYPVAEGLDRRLGYRGEHRRVLFWFEPKAEVVVWQDATGHGFGAGGVATWHEEVTPMVRSARADAVGGAHAPREVLVMDRPTRRACLAPRASAEAFVQT